MEKVQALDDLVCVVARFLLLHFFAILGHMQQSLLRAKFPGSEIVGDKEKVPAAMRE